MRGGIALLRESVTEVGISVPARGSQVSTLGNDVA
jgi:hypothetical protein